MSLQVAPVTLWQLQRTSMFQKTRTTMVVPRKGMLKVEKEVWGKRFPSQRVAREAALDIPRTESRAMEVQES